MAIAKKSLMLAASTLVLISLAGPARTAGASSNNSFFFGRPVKSSPTAPSISSQPASQTVTVGTKATFSVAVTGTAPLAYQWSKNGKAISGARSSTYRTPATTTSESGSEFSVEISNGAGHVNSSMAELTVTATRASTPSTPAISSAPAATLLLSSTAGALTFGDVNVSASTVQDVTLINAGNSNVTISQVTVAGAGFNASGLSGVILAPGQSTTLTATFAPAAAGAAAGEITVSSNASNSPASISVSGTGVAVVSTSSVALSWQESASGVIGYNAYSSTVSGGPYTRLNSEPLASANYTDTTVQAGQTYYYVVTALNSSDVESGFSSQISAAIPQ